MRPLKDTCCDLPILLPAKGIPTIPPRVDPREITLRRPPWEAQMLCWLTSGDKRAHVLARVLVLVPVPLLVPVLVLVLVLDGSIRSEIFGMVLAGMRFGRPRGYIHV